MRKHKYKEMWRAYDRRRWKLEIFKVSVCRVQNVQLEGSIYSQKFSSLSSLSFLSLSPPIFLTHPFLSSSHPIFSSLWWLFYMAHLFLCCSFMFPSFWLIVLHLLLFAFSALLFWKSLTKISTSVTIKKQFGLVQEAGCKTEE